MNERNNARQRVEVQHRDEPNVKKLARALIQLAQDQLLDEPADSQVQFVERHEDDAA